MAGRALFGALIFVGALLAPAFSGSAEAPESKQGKKQDTAAVEKPALPDEIPAPAAAPRAAQIEPVMVEPVKRVAPKVPDIKTPDKKAAIVVTIEKDPTLSETKSATKSCGAGTKRSKDGAKCEKVASAAKKGGKRR